MNTSDARNRTGILPNKSRVAHCHFEIFLCVIAVSPVFRFNKLKLIKGNTLALVTNVVFLTVSDCYTCKVIVMHKYTQHILEIIIILKQLR